jgi:hypothetical protein
VGGQVSPDRCDQLGYILENAVGDHSKCTTKVITGSDAADASKCTTEVIAGPEGGITVLL